jgi:hypothetical protein
MKMSSKVILQNNNGSIMPITRGELVLDSSGNQALRSGQFAASYDGQKGEDGKVSGLYGLMSPTDKYKIYNHTHGLLHHDFTVTVTDGDDPLAEKLGIDTNGYILKVIRSNTNTHPELDSTYSAGIAFGGVDTRGLISCAYNKPSITFAGRNTDTSENGPKWWLRITGNPNEIYELNRMSKWYGNPYTHYVSGSNSAEETSSSNDFLESINKAHKSGSDKTSYEIFKQGCSMFRGTYWFAAHYQFNLDDYINNSYIKLTRWNSGTSSMLSLAGSAVWCMTDPPSGNNTLYKKSILILDRMGDLYSYVDQGLKSNGELDVGSYTAKGWSRYAKVYQDYCANIRISGSKDYFTNLRVSSCTAYGSVGWADLEVGCYSGYDNGLTQPTYGIPGEETRPDYRVRMYINDDDDTSEVYGGLLVSNNPSERYATTTWLLKYNFTKEIASIPLWGNVGNSNTPVYFDNGIPKVCSNIGGSDSSSYELPIASDKELGGIKVGNNLSINTDGVLSATNTTYNAATSNALGLIKVGTVNTAAITAAGTGRNYYPVNVDVNGLGYVALPTFSDGSSATNATNVYINTSSINSYYPMTFVTSTGTGNRKLYIDSSTGTSSSSDGIRYNPSLNTCYCSGGFYEASDEKLKNFGDDIEVDLDKLSKLSKKYFTWKNDESNTQHIGVSAQEVKAIYPELVEVIDEEGHLSVSYDKLSVVALKGIDILNNRIKELESRLDKLENLLNNIK